MVVELPALPDAAVEAGARALGIEFVDPSLTMEDDLVPYAKVVLNAACDPALGPDRLVPARELDEAMQVLDEVTAESCRLGSAGGLMQVERDEALAEVARLRAARPMGGADA